MFGGFWHHEQITANMSYLWYFDYFQHVTLHRTETAVKVIDSCVLVSRIMRQAGISETQMANIVKASASHRPAHRRGYAPIPQLNYTHLQSAPPKSWSGITSSGR